MPDLIGQVISHYLIKSKIGQGGMGVVYSAEDLRLKRTVALKFLLPQSFDSDQEQERLVREARAAAGLDHPSICTIHEVDRAGDQLFIAMAHIEGQPLRERLRAGPLDLSLAVDIAVQTAAGLEEAHRKGVVHRDVKPGNIMITSRGQVKIMDFGLAKRSGSKRLTLSGTRLGTLVYMSPEQARGAQIDPRTDIWSLGVMLYEMITGQLPFAGEQEPATLEAIFRAQPVEIARLRDDVPEALVRIVTRCLQAKRERRYATASDLLIDLRRLQRTMEVATEQLPLARWSPLRAFLRRRWPLGAPLVALLGILAGLLFGPREPLDRLRAFLTGGLSPAKHVVVLPFANIGDDPANQPFCDGLVEILTSKLTQLEEQDGLWVVPASDVRQQRVTSSQAAWETFGVSLAVTGSVQRMGERVLLTLNLVDTQTQRQLRSTVVDARLEEATVLQDGIAVEVAELLDVDLRPAQLRVLSAGRTEVPQAYQFYLEGRGYLQRYERRENVDRAIELLGGAVSEDAEFARAHAALGEAYWRKYGLTHDVRWVTEATASCGRAQELSQELAEVHITLGLIHAGTGEPSAAVEDFARALELEPLNADAYRGLARAYEQQGDLPAAEETYRRAIELRSGSWAAHQELGRFYFKQGRYSEAEGQFLRVIALTPDNSSGYTSLGASYVALQRWDDAYRMFTRSLEIQPTYVAYANLATMFYQQDRFAEAAEMFAQALTFEEHADYRIWGNLAGCQFQLGQQEQAIESSRQAAALAEVQRKVNPRDPELLCLLAVYYQNIGEEERVRPLLEEALRLAPDDVDVAYQAAYTYAEIGDIDRSLICLERALERGYPREQIERAASREQAIRQLQQDPRYAEMMRRIFGQEEP